MTTIILYTLAAGAAFALGYNVSRFVKRRIVR